MQVGRQGVNSEMVQRCTFGDIARALNSFSFGIGWSRKGVSTCSS